MKSTLERGATHRLGVLLVGIEKCFDKISLDCIHKYFKVPCIIRPHLDRWLKVKGKKVQSFGYSNIEVSQAFPIETLICNVVINELVYKTLVNSSKLELFSGLPVTGKFGICKKGKFVQGNIYRKIIAYGDSLIITTTNKNELDLIYKKLLAQLGEISFNFWELKPTFIRHDKDKEKFDYLGFTFLYVSKRKIRPGGILSRSADVALRKYSGVRLGTYLVYPSSESFSEIKSKCKDAIKNLTRWHEISVFNLVNQNLRLYSNYYSWSNGYNRLKSLEGQIVMYLKKFLIRKFRYRGVRRPVWVAQRYLICKQFDRDDSNFLYRGKPSQVKSPYNLRWHPHVVLPKTNSNRKRGKKVLFLVLPSKVNKMLPITTCILPVKVRNSPYYLDPYSYSFFWSKIKERKISNKSYYDKLFINQKGICPKCNLPLTDNLLRLEGWGKLEIHHINPIGEAYKKANKYDERADDISNLQLLHVDCHSEITRVKEPAKP